MIKRISLLIAAAFMALTLAAPAAFAASPSEENCEAQGGTFTRVQGEVKCVLVTIDPGKPHPKDKFTETTVETDQSRGTLKNEPQEVIVPDTSTCSDTGSGKCPPGQF